MGKSIIWLINIYQKTPLKSHSSCVFLPTCSEYTKQSIVKYGAFKGVLRGIIRIFRCHPWQKNRYDPVR
ncbi:MAG: membrane protein insertion efficiency factor YidD [Candidatus Nomurabacteria bacterium]|nr:membrane protein insertion efficiency factor YidD [Candidatus Nomurabacteria bacterium]